MAKYQFQMAAGAERVREYFDGRNGFFNWKGAVRALDQAMMQAENPEKEIEIEFGPISDPEKAAKAQAVAKEWLAHPRRTTTLTDLVGWMMVYGWAVRLNGSTVRSGAAQGRRGMSNPKAISLIAEIAPEPKRRGRPAKEETPAKAEAKAEAKAPAKELEANGSAPAEAEAKAARDTLAEKAANVVTPNAETRRLAREKREKEANG